MCDVRCAWPVFFLHISILVMVLQIFFTYLSPASKRGSAKKLKAHQANVVLFLICKEQNSETKIYRAFHIHFFFWVVKSSRYLSHLETQCRLFMFTVRRYRSSRKQEPNFRLFYANSECHIHKKESREMKFGVACIISERRRRS